ncbi:methyl-accepting chemotaxis protein [Deltaproteobacteria bacterium TL4]
MKIAHKIQALVLISSLFLLITTWSLAQLNNTKLEYYELIEKLDVFQRHLLMALVSHAQFKSSFSEEQKTKKLLETSQDFFKKIPIDLLKDQKQSLDEVQNTLSSFQSVFDQIVDKTRSLLQKKEILNQLVESYSKEIILVNTKIDEKIGNALMTGVTPDVGLYNILNSSRNAFGWLNRVMLSLNQELFLEGNRKKFDQNYQQAMHTLSIEEANLKALVQTEEYKDLTTLATGLTKTLTEMKKLVAESVQLFEETRQLSEQIELDHQKKIHDSIQKIAQFSQESRNRKANEIFWIQLIGVGIIFLLLFVGGGWIALSITRSLNQVVLQIQEVGTQHDLTQRISIQGGEIGEVAHAFNALLNQLEQSVTMIFTNALSLAQNSDDLNQLSSSLFEHAQWMIKQSSASFSLEQAMSHSMQVAEISTEHVSGNVLIISSSIEELSINIMSLATTTQQISDNVQSSNKDIDRAFHNILSIANHMGQFCTSLNHITEHTTQATLIATQANENITKTVETMNHLSQISIEVGHVVKMVSSIAVQTNMLALNATIAAARAGAFGKGFAVVAHEVKELAQQTSVANEEILNKMESIQNCVNASLKSSKTVDDIIKNMVQMNQQVARTIVEQNVLSKEIAISIDQVVILLKNSSKNMEEANHGVQDITKSTSEISIAARDAAQNTAQVADEVKKMAHLNKEVSQNANKLQEYLQKMQRSIKEVEQGTEQTHVKSIDLLNIANSLKESVSIYQIPT